MTILRAAAVILSFSAASSFAQTPPADGAPVAAAPAVSRGALVFSADGKMIGRIDRVDADTVSVIYDERYVTIPKATLSAKGRDFSTSLSRAEINRL